MGLSTVYRYVAREVIVPFFLGLFVLTFVVMMFQILKITEMVVNYGVHVGEVLRALGYILPPLLALTIPMAFFFAVILAFGRLSSDSELVAMKASGIGLRQLLPPVMILAVLTYAAGAWISLHADPWGKRRIKLLLFDLGHKIATLDLQAQYFNDQFPDLVIYVDRVDPVTHELFGVFISDERDPELPNVIVAQKGRIVPQGPGGKLLVQLEMGSINRTLSDSTVYEQVRFDSYEMVLDFAKALGGDRFQKSYLEMSSSELARHIEKMKRDHEDDFKMRRAWVEYHRRYAFPFACIVFGILGVPLGVVPPRSGRGMGYILAIVFLCVYYLMFRVGENLGWKGLVHPMIAMWSPNLIFAGLGAVLLWRKDRERSFLLPRGFSGTLAGLLGGLKKGSNKASTGKER